MGYMATLQSRQGTLFLEGSLIKIYFGLSCSQVFQTLHRTQDFLSLDVFSIQHKYIKTESHIFH